MKKFLLFALLASIPFSFGRVYLESYTDGLQKPDYYDRMDLGNEFIELSGFGIEIPTGNSGYIEVELGCIKNWNGINVDIIAGGIVTYDITWMIYNDYQVSSNVINENVAYTQTNGFPAAKARIRAYNPSANEVTAVTLSISAWNE